MLAGNQLRCCSGAALLIVLASTDSAAADGVTLVDPVITIAGSPAQQSFVVHVDGINENAPATKLDISDLGTPSPPAVTFQFTRVQELKRTATTRDWLVTMTVTDFPPNTKQPRFFSITVPPPDGSQVAGLPISKSVQYTLSSQGTGATLTLVSMPNETTSDDGAATLAIPLSVAVGALPLSGVKLGQSALAEDIRKTQLNFQLCDAADPKCDVPPNHLSANAIQPLILKIAGHGAAPGNYSGNLSLLAVEKPEGVTIPLKVHISDGFRRAWGVVAVVLGVLVVFFVTVYSRYIVNRGQLLLPFILLRQKLASIEAVLKQAPDRCRPFTVNVKTRLDDRQRDINDASLRQAGIQLGAIPSAFGGTISAQSQAVQTLTASVTTWVVALDLIVNDGMLAVWNEAKRELAQPIVQTRAQIQTSALDQILVDPTKPPSSDVINRSIATALAAMRPPVSAAIESVSPPQLRTLRQIDMQLDFVNAAVWTVLLAASVLVGCEVVVFKNGFGAPTDYLACFLWGFGVPLSGTQLMSLTPKSVATNLGISIPQ